MSNREEILPTPGRAGSVSNKNTPRATNPEENQHTQQKENQGTSLQFTEGGFIETI
jgi:hypothetical protein